MKQCSVLLIDHKHGVNVTVHWTHEQAKAALLAYVADWWEQETGTVVMPHDPDEAIEEYFAAATDEDWRILDAELADPPSASETAATQD